jgi:succinoglycan biosynthesis transport protein ExoP
MTDNGSHAMPDDERRRPGDLLRILIRRRWFFLGPLFVIGLLGFSAAQIVPLQYRSEAFIIVDQQKIPEQYVTSNVLITLQRRLDSMTQQILSRSRLQRYIEEFGLYTRERKKMALDDIIDLMRKRISIELVQTPGRKEDLTGFRIYFTDRDPYLAQRVTGELTSLFIEQNVRERTQQSMGTTAFLESQLEEARKELATVEERVRQYKLQHLGQLPEQQQSNLQILSSLQAQLHANTSALDRAEQQRIYLESMRSQHEAARGLPRPGEAPSSTGSMSPGSSSLPLAEATLADLWKQLNALSGKFTDRHPEIARLKLEIANWETAVQRLRAERMPMAEIDSRLKSIQAEIENGKRDSAELRKRIPEVQNRLNMTPVREQELAGVLRQYESARTQFQSLLQKKMGSELASNLEQRQGGEQFRLLDPASLPKRPEPGRLKIIALAWVLGIGLGVALTAMREFTDQTVHRDTDLESLDSIDILARIPTLRTTNEQGRQKLLRTAEVVALALVTLVSLGTGAHTFLNR